MSPHNQPLKSITFDSKFDHKIKNDKTSIAKKQKNSKNNNNKDCSPNNRAKSKFSIYDTLKSVNDIKQKKHDEKTDHVISLLHIIKTLKKAANLFKSRAGLTPVQQLSENEIAFMNDLSYFPDISSRRFFLKRYTEKNV